MRENRLGTAVSVLVHLCIILPLLAASSAVQNRPVKVVEIDFSVIKDQLWECPIPKTKKKMIEKKAGVLKGERAPGRIVKPDQPVKQNPETVPAKEQVKPPPFPTIVTASDAQNKIVVHGTSATYAGSSGSGKSLQPHGNLAGDMEDGSQGSGGQGGDSLAEGSKDYNYIRNAIMKNIKYPDRARMLGFEGKVLLSFIVLENGSTREIRVINSSGHRLLDENAKETVATTHIARKLPYRVVVRLPITYTLRVTKDEPT
jgi:periplasmic protein TonB